VSRPPTVPAVWAAFANASRWKSWALLAQFGLNAFLLAVALSLARRDPDVVVVAEDGKSTYVPRAVAGAALVRFLEEQKQVPSDVTVVRFTRDFCEAFFAVNSATLDASFGKALGMMDARLREAIRKEYVDGKVLEAMRAAKTSSRLTVDELTVLQKTDALIALKARVTRRRWSMVEGRWDEDRPSVVDTLGVELVERVVPRTMERPDGLELAELSVSKETPGVR